MNNAFAALELRSAKERIHRNAEHLLSGKIDHGEFAQLIASDIVMIRRDSIGTFADWLFHITQPGSDMR